CAKEREAPITLEHLEARAGRAAYAVRERLIERSPDADRAIDHRLLGIDVTVREREVRFLEMPALELPRHLSMDVEILRDDEEARRIAIEPMAEPGHDGLVRRAARVIAVVEVVDQRVVDVPAHGMDEDARGLVEREKPGVLVERGKGARVVIVGNTGPRREPDRHHVPVTDLSRRLRWPSVDRDPTFADERLNAVSRAPRHVVEKIMIDAHVAIASHLDHELASFDR